MESTDDLHSVDFPSQDAGTGSSCSTRTGSLSCAKFPVLELIRPREGLAQLCPNGLPTGRGQELALPLLDA